MLRSVAGALAPHGAELSADVYDLIIREIPQLRLDRQGLTLLDTGVSENVATVLHILQHGIDIEADTHPADRRGARPPVGAAGGAADRPATVIPNRGNSVPALVLPGAGPADSRRHRRQCGRDCSSPRSSASYIDRVSEELVSTYEHEREHWLRNLSAARDGRVKALLRGERVDIDSSEAILGYRLRQHHVGVVCWMHEADAGAGALAQARTRHGRRRRARGVRGPADVRPEGRLVCLGVVAARWAALARSGGISGVRRRHPVRLRRGRCGPRRLPPDSSAGVGSPGGRHGSRSVRADGDQLPGRRTARPHGELDRAHPRLGRRYPRRSRRRRRAGVRGSATRCGCSSARRAASRPPRRSSFCTRTRSSTGFGRPKTSSAPTSTRTDSRSSWPCSHAGGSERRSCGPVRTGCETRRRTRAADVRRALGGLPAGR